MIQRSSRRSRACSTCATAPSSAPLDRHFVRNSTIGGARVSHGSVLSVLFKVLGKRVFLSFSLVSFLVVFLLAAVTVTSRYAMQRYVADQIERVPWDLSVYQTAEVPLAGKLRDAVADLSGVAASERLYF